MAEKTNKATVSEPVTDPMKELVEIMLPFVPGEPETVFVGLNGKGYTIERGVPVKIPKPVKAILDESAAKKQQQLAMIRELEAKAREPKQVF